MPHSVVWESVSVSNRADVYWNWARVVEWEILVVNDSSHSSCSLLSEWAFPQSVTDGVLRRTGWRIAVRECRRWVERATEESSNGRPCCIVVREWPRLVVAVFCCSGRCCPGAVTFLWNARDAILRRRRSSRRRDPACLNWSNARSSLSASGGRRSPRKSTSPRSRKTYLTFFPFTFLPYSAILLRSVTSVTEFCVNCLLVRWTIVVLTIFSRFVVRKRETFFLLVLDWLYLPNEHNCLFDLTSCWLHDRCLIFVLCSIGSRLEHFDNWT